MNSGQKSIKNKRQIATRKILIVFIVLIGIAIVVFRNAYVNVAEIKKQTIQNLEDVAEQNAMILESQIDARYQVLMSLAQELDGVSENTIESKLNHFRIFLDEFELKRFAYCFPDGTTYSTDGQIQDLSYREFYQAGMQGECYITGVLSDALREEHVPVNVMTIPVYDDQGAVSGVFGLAYDTEIFNQSLQIDSFDGAGYSCILNEEGQIMSVTGESGLALSHNFIGDVLEQDARNERLITDFQNFMDQKIQGVGTLYLSEKVYYDMIPVELMGGSVTWYMMTVIPAGIVEERIDPIQKNQHITVCLVVLLIVAGGLLIIMYMQEQHRQLLTDAYEDPVTGGANYTKLQAQMEERADHRGVLVVMDIANFNNIVVVAGELAANQMIKETWNILNGIRDRDDLAAHVRDDVFLLFLTEQDEDVVLRRMELVSEEISERAKAFEVYGVRARYGMYQMSEEETLESAYSKVKLAREDAIVRMDSDHAFYNEVARMKMQHERELEDHFPLALEQQEFEVWYQPKYSADSCRIVGSEALVRWRKANGEMISPGEFIPLFEHNGMIVKLDEYMFRSVCRQQKKWLEEGKHVFPVSINISRASLYCLDVHKRYKSIIDEYGIEPAYIQLEVTETVMEEKQDIRELLNKFRKMGIKILMDDFGTGYSSLATLSLQCFDTLKLDKTLIDHIGNRDGETMLYHIIRMGQQMGLRITAEGVEKQEQLSFLQNMSCDDIQGFYFSRPLPKGEYEALMNTK